MTHPIGKAIALLFTSSLLLVPIPSSGTVTWGEGTPPIGLPVTRFAAQLDASLATGSWLLSTAATMDGAPWLIASGTVPSNGRVSFWVATQTALLSADKFFRFYATKSISPAVINVSVATVGTTAEILGGSPTFDLGQRPFKPVSGYPTREAASAAANCPPCPPTHEGLPAPPEAPDTLPQPVPADGTGGTPPSQEGQDSSNDGLEHAWSSYPCDTLNRCGTALAPEIEVDTECTTSWGVTDCIEARRTIPNNWTFRGWSERIAGSTSVFKVLSEASFKQEDGFRLESGAFEFSGHTTKTNATGDEDMFRKRTDCWVPTQPEDDCSNTAIGHWPKANFETWRWEKHTIYAQGSYFTVEHLHDILYDGGTSDLFVRPIGTAGYYKKPSELAAGGGGSHAIFDPGTSRRTIMSNKTEWSFGTRISVDFPESYGSTNYWSSITFERLDKVENYYVFRSLPFMYKYHRYDRGSGWRVEYWTCEYKSNKTSDRYCYSQGV